VACGSSSGSTPATPSLASNPTAANATSQAATPSSSVNFSAGPATDYVIHYAAADGTKVTVTFSLHSAVHSNDDTLHSWYPSGAPCQADPQRDAVIAGTLTVSNDTPTFKAGIGMVIGAASLNPPAGTSLSMGLAYTDNPRCINVNGLNSDDGPLVSPSFNGQSTWGQTSVEFIVHGAYTPLNSLGDPSAIPPNLPMLTAYEGQPAASQQYSVDSESRGVRPGVQSNVYLDLQTLI